LTPNNIGQLSGSPQKFHENAADEGVIIVDVDGGPTFKVTTVQRNKPAQLVFLVPSLPGGSYRIEVRAKVGASTQLRTGTLDATLVVNGARRPKIAPKLSTVPRRLG
jgi:hypothetical protein